MSFYDTLLAKSLGGGGGGGDDSVLIDLIERDITSIDIPYGTTLIGSSVFNRCTKLERVTIPSSVTNIGTNAFSNCSNLKSITVKAMNPPTLDSSAFLNVPANANIYVPAESVEAYKAATYWSNRASYIQAIPE